MKLFIILTSFCVIASLTQAQITTNINWVQKNSKPAEQQVFYDKKRKLTWADFLGTPNLPDPVAAITASGFGYSTKISTSNNKGTIAIDIYCNFSKLNSWVKKDKNTAYILKHEQHHFDVTYLAAIQFINNVKTAKLTVNNTTYLLADLYKQSCDYMNNLQNEYDTQTKNGQIKNKQAEWNAYFEKRLLEVKM